MKEILPADLKRALDLRRQRMESGRLSNDALVQSVVDSRRCRPRKRASRVRRIAMLAAGVAAVLAAVVFTVPRRVDSTSRSAEHIVAELAKSGIQGRCSMSETRCELPDGSVVITCRVVVVLDESCSAGIEEYGRKLASVTAVYDSIVRDSSTFSSLYTELLFEDGYVIAGGRY